MIERGKQYSGEHLTGQLIEIGGVSVKCIASNIRRPAKDWNIGIRLEQSIGREGDLIAVEALSDSGSTTHVENQTGRDEHLYRGDRFIGVLANRFSGTSESGGIPEEGIEFCEDTVVHLLATGGVIGINTGIPQRLFQQPFALKPLGILHKDDKPLSLNELYSPWHESLHQSAPIVLVCGTSAEVGKTTTAASLIRAFRLEGVKVAGTKFAGTGRMRDILTLRDAGAFPWLDFPDVGLATTYTGAERFKKATYTLFNYINAENPAIIVAEAGGDPIEANIPTFFTDEELMRYVTSIVIVAGDVMGMMGSVDYLRRYTTAPMFLVDPKDRNTVTTRERIKQVLPGMPIFNSLQIKEVQKIAQEILLKSSIVSHREHWVKRRSKLNKAADKISTNPLF